MPRKIKPSVASAIKKLPATASAHKTNKQTKRQLKHLHIDGSKTTVGNGTADGTGKGESGV